MQGAGDFDSQTPGKWLWQRKWQRPPALRLAARLAATKHVTTANYRTAYIASESFSYMATSK